MSDWNTVPKLRSGSDDTAGDRPAMTDLWQRIAERDREIERLQAVIREMATVEPSPRLSGPTAGWEMAERLLGMAQAALEADNDE